MPKLTLSVDQAVVSQAKNFAREQGVSLSKLVENYLNAVTQMAATEPDPPVLRALRGKLRPSDCDDYFRYLTEKYR